MLTAFLAFSQRYFFVAHVLSPFHNFHLALSTRQSRDTAGRCWRTSRNEEKRNERGKCRRNGERRNPTQATEGVRSMHPYARLPARVRRPASSPDVILPYPRSRIILSRADTNAMVGVDQTEFLSFEKWIGPLSCSNRLRRLGTVS